MLTGWLVESNLRGWQVQRMQAASERRSRGQSYHSLNKCFTSRMPGTVLGAKGRGVNKRQPSLLGTAQQR